MSPLRARRVPFAVCGTMLACATFVGCSGGSDAPTTGSGTSGADANGPVSIMPIGDSITSGPYYRVFLAQRLASSECDVDFVGAFAGVGGEAAVATDGLDLDHQSIGGANSAEILTALEAELERTRPDIALIYAGTNDFYTGLTRDTTIANLTTMVDVLRAANPQVVVLVSELMPLAGIEVGVEALNGRIDELVTRLDRPASPVTLVDMHTGVDVLDDLVDGVHPDVERSREMADRWIEALTGRLGDGCIT